PQGAARPYADPARAPNPYRCCEAQPGRRDPDRGPSSRRLERGIRDWFETRSFPAPKQTRSRSLRQGENSCARTYTTGSSYSDCMPADPSQSSQPTPFFGLTAEEFDTLVQSWGWPRFRAQQVRDWVYTKNV